jgi:ribosome recycling factor
MIAKPDQIHSETKNHMEKTVAALQSQFSKLKTGRASPALLEMVRVMQMDGQTIPLKGLATISVADARTLLITPFDKSQIAAIEKAILNIPELGLNPSLTGHIIRVPFPPLTETRRRELTKILHQYAEQARNSIRQHRREANTLLKTLTKTKQISEDQEKREQKSIEKLTDQFIARIDTMTHEKDKQVMEV